MNTTRTAACPKSEATTSKQPVMETHTANASITERLERTTSELKALEHLIVSADFSPQILSEFRNAVDSIRQTARVVQTWIGLQQQNRDPYSAVRTMSNDRVRRVTQMAREVTIDLESLEIDLATEGLGDLLRAIEDLRERLLPLFPRQP